MYNTNNSLMLKIYNNIWITGNYLKFWKISKVTIIPKEKKIKVDRAVIDLYVYFLIWLEQLILIMVKASLQFRNLLKETLRKIKNLGK